MSHLHDSSLISDAYVYGVPGLGILGADIPAAGDNGPSPVLNDDVSADKEYFWRVETPPGSGTLTLFDDLTFTLEGAADGNWPWSYRLWEDGADQGTATVYSQVGSPAGAFSAALSDVAFSGGASVSGAVASFSATTADVVFSGGAQSVTGGAFAITTDAVTFSGGAVVVPRCSYAITLADVVFSGGARSGDAQVIPARRRIGTGTDTARPTNTVSGRRSSNQQARVA